MTAVFLTSTQMARYGDQYRAALPGGRFLELEPDGRILDGGRPIDRDRAVADVAFGSTDLFDGADHTATQRHFFGWLLHTEPPAWFHIAAAGVDNPIFGMLLDRGTRLTTSHHTAIPISEYVLAQVLRARVPIDQMADDRRHRRWQHAEWNEVAASRWLVVGMGSIGQEVARRARAFGAHVTGVRRSPSGSEPCDAMIPPDELVEAIGQHDVVVLAVPATAATVNLVDRRLLAAMHPDTILVNVGRGSLVDEDALREGLEQGRPQRAILDVTATEPTPDGHWLWDHPAVVLTAHTSSGGRQRYDRAAAVFAENLRRFAAGEPLLSEVTAATREPPA